MMFLRGINEKRGPEPTRRHGGAPRGDARPQGARPRISRCAFRRSAPLIVARGDQQDGMPGAADNRAGGALAFCFSENPARCDQSSFTSAALITAAHFAI